jgi:FKBP-type peptidyl-prolyl cis-trans isomerase FkpA
MMKRYFLFLLVLPLVTLSCDEQKTPFELNLEEINNYIEENNLDMIEDPTGLYYSIEVEGTGGNPTSSANVEVKYTGYFTDGTIFDQTPGDNTREFNLQRTIAAWQIGIPKMKKGGKAKIIAPSSLGYGFFGSGSVPPNAVLVFDIELVNFQN